MTEKAKRWWKAAGIRALKTSAQTVMTEKAKRWWKAAGIRALKTSAQTAVATIGTAAFLSQVDAMMVISASALAGILSLLTSVAGLPELEE